jgi:hypothetical protein
MTTMVVFVGDTAAPLMVMVVEVLAVTWRFCAT